MRSLRHSNNSGTVHQLSASTIQHCGQRRAPSLQIAERDWHYKMRCAGVAGFPNLSSKETPARHDAGSEATGYRDYAARCRLPAPPEQTAERLRDAFQARRQEYGTVAATRSRRAGGQHRCSGRRWNRLGIEPLVRRFVRDGNRSSPSGRVVATTTRQRKSTRRPRPPSFQHWGTWGVRPAALRGLTSPPETWLPGCDPQYAPQWA
jgi:hypothetical protein